MLGIDVLESQGFGLLAGKRVGLITNQTSYNNRGTRTRVVLKRARQVNLVALYAPEHGIDGNVKAGDHIDTRRDTLTGLITHSLYGVTRKPSPAQLAGIDVMVFDLQDIGVRSYTYISTMVRSMEACGERGIPFVVLDRPNPIGGHGVFGPPLEKKWESFVGQIPVPYVHGMTVGELAMMTAASGWISRRPQLHVVKMRGWNRSMHWDDTRLRWYPTSPNIPKSTSPFFYAMTGMLGGLTPVDIGIGTKDAFEFAAGEGVDPNEFSQTMNRYRFAGTRFEPYVSKTRAGRNGSRIRSSPQSGVDPVAIDVACIFELHRRVPGGLLTRVSSSGLSLFNKVYGSDQLEQALRRGGDPQRLISSWQSANNRFRQNRQHYLLYP
ncbi:MAG: hypothetical protein ACI8T1_000723 [Verrucomicrobiales bacterium]|jgi:uncharacterized protein YbbC (DUF1343 family)